MYTSSSDGWLIAKSVFVYPKKGTLLYVYEFDWLCVEKLGRYIIYVYI